VIGHITRREPSRDNPSLLREHAKNNGVRSHGRTPEEIHVQLCLGALPGRGYPGLGLFARLDQDVTVFGPDAQPIGLAPDEPIPDHKGQDQNDPAVVATDDYT